jgi:hypothetical protein
MKYRVRNQDGELEYGSFGQVEQAWLMGLIEPEDEILEEGKTMWRKAKSLPLLVRARRSGDQVWMGTWFIWILIGVIGGSAALYQFHEKNYAVGFIIAFAVAAVMFNITVKAYQKRKPHGP